MRAVIQRTFETALFVDGKEISRIPSGLTVFLAVCRGDTEEQADYFARKLSNLRVFRDENGKMNKSIRDADFGHAELPDRARELYERVIGKLREEGLTVKTGVFGAHMYIEQKQDGPLSFIFEC